MDVAIIGAGRVGTALGVLLARGGHSIVAASGRDASRERVGRHLPEVPFLGPVEAANRGEAVILGVPDDRIRRSCEALARGGGVRGGQSVIHLSGSVPLEALSAAREAGAGILALHPLQTFPDVEAAVERLPGSAMAVTAPDEDGYVLGERLAADVGGRPFRLPDERKPLYHAAAVFASGYLATLVGMAADLLGRAGVENPMRALSPLAEATLANAVRLGPPASVTGPMVRGDAGTLRRNLEALAARAPEAVPPYVALAAAALDVAEAAGRLRAEDRARVEEVLAAWR